MIGCISYPRLRGFHLGIYPFMSTVRFKGRPLPPSTCIGNLFFFFFFLTVAVLYCICSFSSFKKNAISFSHASSSVGLVQDTTLVRTILDGLSLNFVQAGTIPEG